MTADKALNKYLQKLQEIEERKAELEQNIEEAFNLFQEEFKEIYTKKNHGSKDVDLEC